MDAQEATGGLWWPAELDEIEAFEREWCSHCLNLAESEAFEDEFGNEHKTCHVMTIALWSRNPSAISVRDGKPYCTKFRDDPGNPMRCPMTMEMFDDCMEEDC